MFILFVSEYLQGEEAIQDLIQDLRFETATSKVKATPDGEFLIASGASKLAFYFCVFNISCDLVILIILK